MVERTICSTVTFAHPFTVRGVEGIRRAGTYAVETDEELILGLGFGASRRGTTFLFLPGGTGGSVVDEVVNVAASDLQAALANDAKTSAR
jgi:hypothetical protein